MRIKMKLLLAKAAYYFIGAIVYIVFAPVYLGILAGGYLSTITDRLDRYIEKQKKENRNENQEKS